MMEYPEWLDSREPIFDSSYYHGKGVSNNSTPQSSIHGNQTASAKNKGRNTGIALFGWLGCAALFGAPRISQPHLSSLRICLNESGLPCSEEDEIYVMMTHGGSKKEYVYLKTSDGMQIAGRLQLQELQKQNSIAFQSIVNCHLGWLESNPLYKAVYTRQMTSGFFNFAQTDKNTSDRLMEADAWSRCFMADVARVLVSPTSGYRERECQLEIAEDVRHAARFSPLAFEHGCPEEFSVARVLAVSRSPTNAWIIEYSTRRNARQRNACDRFHALEQEDSDSGSDRPKA